MDQEMVGAPCASLRTPAAIERDLRALGIYEEVEDICARRGILRVRDVLGRARHAHVATARHEVTMFLRRRFGWSYPALGMFLGRDHTTIMHAVRKARAIEVASVARELEDMEASRVVS